MSYEKRFVLANKTRQDVINWSRGEWFKHTDAATAVNADRAFVYRCCKAMARDLEAEVKGYGKDLMFRTVAKKTMSIEEMVKRAGTKRAEREPKEDEDGNGIVRKPGFYSQRGGRWKPSSEGGQGAVRQAVGVASSFGMV